MMLRALRGAAVLALLPLVLSGCGPLLGSLYPMDPFTDPSNDPFLNPDGSAEFDR